MIKYSVVKRFEFPYGHRLLNHKGSCRYIHGHNAIVEVELSSGLVDDMGVVIDFSEMNQKIKKYIEENLDHAFIYNKRDTVVVELLKLCPDQKVFELSENPTAENLAKHLYYVCKKLFNYNNGIEVESVVFYETSNSYAKYSEQK